MPITVEWDNEAPNAMIHRYTGAWTCEDYDRATALARHMLLERGDFGCYIVDMTQSGALPSGIAARIIHVAEERPALQGPTIIVGIHPNKNMLTLFQSGLRVFPHLGKLFLLAESLDAARLLVAEQYARYEVGR